MQNSISKIPQFQAVIDALDPNGQPEATFVYESPTVLKNRDRGIAILDASFNPMTFAHEHLTVATQRKLGLDEVILMLSRTNVDKGIFGASLGQRLAMLDAYARIRSNISIAACSHARFIDKALALRAYFSAATPCYFIIGYDTLIRLFDPQYYTDMPEELTPFFAQNHIVAANRGESDSHVVKAFIAQSICSPFANHLHTIDLPENTASISSTQLREKASKHLPIGHLSPEPIPQMISHLRLYNA